MGMNSNRAKAGAIGLAMALLAGCIGAPSAGPRASPTPASDTSSTPTAAPRDTGWVTVTPGLERRAIDVPFQPLGLPERVVAFRIQPELFTFRVRYTPGLPEFVAAWEPRARLVFNASFFDENDAALGLVVSDGQVFGRSYEDFGGMLQVAADGGVRVRSLTAEPYQPDEGLTQAAQGFPMLIRPDGALYTDEDGARARRTVVAQDGEGRVLVIVAPLGLFTLAEMAAWLHNADFGLTVALNFDGGGSTGYAAGPNDRADSITAVPVVVAIFDR